MLALLLLACEPSPTPLAEGLPAAADATHDLVASEELLLHLTPSLALLSSDLVDGGLPGKSSADVFDSTIRIRDLADPSARAQSTLRPGIARQAWPLGAPKHVAKTGLSLLAPLHDAIAAPRHA
ncbi:MAG: hypothetical protein VX000_17930, partial [Myxococcota bacterium]|nr:hypothetical protein [Myxococcota bacterium]